MTADLVFSKQFFFKQNEDHTEPGRRHCASVKGISGGHSHSEPIRETHRMLYVPERGANDVWIVT